MATAYTNGNIFTGEKTETGKAVLVEDNIITGIVKDSDIPSSYKKIDIQGDTLAPAFIDMQIYGGNGKMFSQELSIESLQSTYEYCVSGGCKYFMITLATNTIDKFLKSFEVAKAYWAAGGKGLLGIHLEGPYINFSKKGAHIPHCIKKPTIDEVSLLLQKGERVFKMMTIAPEECSDEVIDLLVKHNILLSAGHTNATYKQAQHGFDKGIPAATHLFNAMSALQHREPGMVGAIFNSPTVMSSLVCDGIHVDFAAIKIAKKVMQHRLFYITDAVAETTTGEYQHVFKGDHYALPDGTLSGSSLTMMQCVKNGVEKAGIELEESLRMASTYPAQLLTGHKLGKIEKGYSADFVVFDKALTVVATY